MAAVSRTGSGRMYSWWWDSHISPKNSKWLQENLTDVDVKVKAMIKLIEEDADSFARRAEMYYKKRPELMKLVEELYRAYRALAERYDHANGVIRQAQRTMVEAFPNQVPFMLVDDSPTGSAHGDSPTTPVRSFFEPDKFPKDGLGMRNLDSSDVKKNGSVHSGLGDSAKSGEGRARKGLKFDEPLENDGIERTESQKDQNHMSATKQTDDSEEILLLKKALAEVKAQKDAGLIQYQQSLVKLSNLESEVSRTQENSRGLCERANQAESEIQALKESLVKLEAEKEANLQKYRECLNQISNLENSNSCLQEETCDLKERTTRAETEAQSFREENFEVLAEKDKALSQYMVSLEMISNLEHKVQCCEEDARNLKERVEKAENEVETLKQGISKLVEEKDAAVLQYQQCMITISNLEHKLTSAQEEAERLNIEIENGVASLKSAEEQCIGLEKSNQSLHHEVESLMLKMDSQSQELTEKQKELGRLWACIQGERLRFVEAETAFQTLQHLHAQAQNELRSLASELQNKVQSLTIVETLNKKLQDQIMTVNEDNKNLNALNMSSSLSMQELGNTVSVLKETKGKLEEELELRLDQRNALQQEIYCLKEELNVLNKQHSSIMVQVHAVGLSPECLESSVKELQDENSSLKETCLREKNALLEKLIILDKLFEENSMLETSLSDMNTELEALRVKIEALEASYKSLSEEKSSLFDDKTSLETELKLVNLNLLQISEENALLQNSLSNAHGELEGLKIKSSSLEDYLKLLVNQKDIMATGKDHLTSELVSTQVMLENLENIYSELGENYLVLEKEKEASVCKIEELNISLEVEKKERVKFEQLNKLQLCKIENEMNLLLKELEHTKGEHDKELQRAFEGQTEIYILHRCAQDLGKKNFDLLTENHRLTETSESLADSFAGLKQTYLNQEIEMKAVSEQASSLRRGIVKFFKAIDVDLDHEFVGRSDDDHIGCILSKLGETQTSIHRSEEEKISLYTELSVLVTMLQQLQIEAENLAIEKSFIDQEFRIRVDQLTMSQDENLKLRKMKEEMTEKIRDGVHKEEESRMQMLDLQNKLLNVQRENVQVSQEKGSLKNELLLLEEKSRMLEEENCSFRMEVVSLDMLSVFFRNSLYEKSMELKAVAEDLYQLNGANFAVNQRLNLTEMMLDDMLIKKGMELQQLQEEHEKAKKLQSEASRSEQQMLIQETELWEKQASMFFDEVQVSNVYQIVYKQKLLELAEACDRFVGENTSKESCINHLSETVGALTSQNGNLKAQFAAYGHAITSLKQCISSLEKSEKPLSSELKDAENGNEMHDISVCSKDVMVLDPISDLQDLQRRIGSIAKAAVEREQLLVQENAKVHAELDSAMKQIAELKSDSSLHRRRPGSETSYNGLFTKDIVLDQVSESSQYVRSKREHAESWESADIDCSTDLKVSKDNMVSSLSTEKQANFHRTKSVKKQNSNRPSLDAMVEKELGVDKLEISKRSTEPQKEGQRKRVLERLSSDVQKLANLQMTIEELRRKLKIIDTSKKGKSMEECDILKEQLEEADASILKLFDLNAKLLKNVDGTPLSAHSKSSMETDESGSAKGWRISEQARRMSEKIGRLQMEVQKIEFVLLKLEAENNSKGKNRISEARRRVLLKDYLYGSGVKSANKGKKSALCCIRPQTNGD